MPHAPDAGRSRRRIVMLSTMAASIMNQIDTTIANVALPHIQGSTSASRDQIVWVLTSYIVALAIMTPLSGWLASRFGRRRLLLLSVAGFTIASGLCGIATNLSELVAFRILQGATGSALVPLSQATLLDSYPVREHGKAMTIFGLATILGPLVGPVLGGYLTDNLSWHWVFLINLPVGLLAFVGLWTNMAETAPDRSRRFDLMGFGLLSVGIGAAQLMLDRGQQLDWFDSVEICAEAVVAMVAMAMFVVHVLTTQQPFVRLAIFRDRNYVLTSVLWFAVGIMIFSILALIPPMLEGLMGYPTLLIGLVTAPRGLGTLCAMLLMGRIYNRVDARLLVVVGVALAAYSSFQLSAMSLAADASPVMLSGLLNGFGTSMISVPISAMAFATLPAVYRNEGAAFAVLVRYMGSSTGIALLQALTTRNTAVVQSRLVEGVRLDNPVMALRMPGLDMGAAGALARMNVEIVRQATMVAYVDSFWALGWVGLAAAPLALLLRRPKR